MRRDVLAYRSQEHPGEPAVAARADHEQIGVLGEVDEQFRCVALLDPRMYEDRRILAEDVPNRFHQQIFRRLPGIIPGIGCSILNVQQDYTFQPIATVSWARNSMDRCGVCERIMGKVDDAFCSPQRPPAMPLERAGQRVSRSGSMADMPRRKPYPTDASDEEWARRRREAQERLEDDGRGREKPRR